MLLQMKLRSFKLSLTTQVFLGLIVGILLGCFAPQVAAELKPLSTIFLRMIKMLIAPLLFATLTLGIAGTGNHKNLGRMGLKTFVYFELVTTAALVIGLVVANVCQPGSGMTLQWLSQHNDAHALQELSHITQNANTMSHQSHWDLFIQLFPTSVIDAMARGDILQLVVFSVFFGLGLAAAGDRGKPVFTLLEGLSEVMFKFVGYVMAFAPLGVMGAMAYTISVNGFGVLWVYAKLLGSLYLALALFVFLVLYSVCAWAKVPFGRLLQTIKEPFLLAFSTASSEAALPKAMQVMERFGVPKAIVGFVMPTGYSFNLDGSTLYLALAALFVAQMAGIELSLQQQILMMLTLMVTSKGVAAVPRASLVILAGTLTGFGLPVEGIAVILGIDHLLDMGRTSINLLGNCVATTVIARWEGCLDDAAMAGINADTTEALASKATSLKPQVI